MIQMKVKTRLLSFVLLVLICLTLTPTAKAASVWSQTYGEETTNEVALSVVETPDGGYALAGCQLFVKTDADGNMEWNRTYQGGTIYVLTATSDGGYALGGTKLVDEQYLDFWLIKTDSYGNTQWNKTYSRMSDSYAYALVATPDGGYALGGDSTSDEYACFWLIKTDAAGNAQWNQTYSNPNVNALIQTSDGGYAMTGATNPIDSDLDFWLAKTDELGNMQWNQTYGGTDNEMADALVQAQDGGYALAGTTNYNYIILANQYGIQATQSQDSYAWLVKTDADGNMQWNRTYVDDEAYSLVATADGGYAMAGYANENQTAWLLKTDTLGNNEWIQYYEGNSTYLVEAIALIVASDGGYAMAGCIYYTLEETLDFWLAKTNEFGAVPEQFSLILVALFFAATVPILLGKKKLLGKNH
jgi:hypothetical protein